MSQKSLHDAVKDRKSYIAELCVELAKKNRNDSLARRRKNRSFHNYAKELLTRVNSSSSSTFPTSTSLSNNTGFSTSSIGNINGHFMNHSHKGIMVSTQEESYGLNSNFCVPKHYVTYNRSVNINDSSSYGDSRDTIISDNHDNDTELLGLIADALEHEFYLKQNGNYDTDERDIELQMLQEEEEAEMIFAASDNCSSSSQIDEYELNSSTSNICIGTK